MFDIASIHEAGLTGARPALGDMAWGNIETIYKAGSTSAHHSAGQVLVQQ